MEAFNKQTLRRLAAAHDTPCITMYLPARHTGANAAGDVTRLKNMLREAGSRAGDVAPELVETALRPIRSLADDFDFWNDPEHGLAIFSSPDTFEAFRTPIPVEEQVHVGSGFDLTQLLPLAVEDGTFFLLNLDQNRPALFRMTRWESREVSLPGELSEVRPHGRAEGSSGVQLHSGTAPVHGERSKRSAVFHGPEPADHAESQLEKLMHALDREVLHVDGVASAPLVLAGVEYLRAMYRSLSRHQHIVDGGIDGGAGRLGAVELRAGAWDLVAPWFEQQKQTALRMLQNLGGTGLTSVDPAEIRRSAEEGRVKMLLVAMGNGTGARDGDGRAELIRSALACDATIYPVSPAQIPDDGEVAAIMRY